MKESWTYKKLGEVARVQNGYAFDSKLFNENGNGTPLIRIRDIKRNHTYTYTTEDCSKEFFIENGDLLIGMDGDFNVCTWEGGHAYLNQRVCHVIPSNQVIAKFLYYLLPFPLKRINDKTTFATVKHLSSKQVGNIMMPVPSLDEQQRVVERLDAAFENIEKLKANAEKQLAEAQTLFQKSLAKAMKPKEGWEEKTMSEITEVKDGTHDSPKYVTEGIPFVTQKNITINGFDLINTKKITLEDHKKFYTRSNVEFGDIIIAMIGANRGMSCIVNTREIFSIKNVGLIKKTDNINMRFLLYYLHSPAANSYVLENSNGGAQEFIGLKGLRNFPIQFPSLAEQQRIVERLDALSENIRKYEEFQRQIISECDALKQALLRKVFE